MTEAERVERVAISMAEFDLGHGIWPKLSEFERGAWLFKAGSVISTYLAMLATEAAGKKALEQQNNSSGLVPVSPGVYAPVPGDAPPLGHKEGDIITYVMENGNGRILHVERPTVTDMMNVPREILQEVHDALEQVEDCFEFNSPTWVLYNQISVLLDPASAGLAPATPNIQDSGHD